MVLDQAPPSPDHGHDVEHFISLDDAVELTGYAAHYLRRLIQLGQLICRGGRHDPFIPWSEILRLRKTQRPFWQVAGDTEHFTPNLALDDNVPSGSEQPWEANRIDTANVIDWLETIPRSSVQTVVSSPPYWGQRQYADETATTWSDGNCVAFGREATVEEYIRHTMDIFRRLKRVLRDDGTIWWIIGDTYLTRTIVRESTGERWDNYQGKRTTAWADNPNRRQSAGHPYLKDKDLTLVPFLVAHGAQHLGFYVRSMIIWSKQLSTSAKANREPSRTHMPEPVKDRPTTGHEYVLLLAKAQRYSYSDTDNRSGGDTEYESLKQLRTVWSFPVSTNHGGHTAAFPIELPSRCIRLATKPGDLVIDPFAGSGNTLIAAKQLGRQYAGCDISLTYTEEARSRLANSDQSRKRTRPSRTPPFQNGTLPLMQVNDEAE